MESSSAAAAEWMRSAVEKRCGPKFAIIDTDIPGIDTLNLVRRMKADAVAGDVRVIALTRLGQRLSDEVMAEAGVHTCISKPVRYRDLCERLVTLMDEATAATPAERTSKIEKPAWRGQKRILIVEDNPVNQRVALHMLDRLGYKAEAVANGLEALDALGKIPYSLVLMDCHMPEMDGYETTQEIRRRERNNGHLVVVALTASSLPSDRKKCIEAGMDDFVTKPVQLQNLAATLDRWLDESRPEGIAR
jgi:CheY-like chemotaxis protein